MGKKWRRTLMWNICSFWNYGEDFLKLAFLGVFWLMIIIIRKNEVFFSNSMTINRNFDNWSVKIMTQIMAVVLMAASVAATAIGYVGKYGNSHTGWIAICDHFPKFCNRATLSALFSYLAFIFYLVLTIISANISRQIVQD